MEKEKTIFTIKELSKTYDFPEFGLRTLIKQGRFSVIQVGKRSYIVRTIFEDYLKAGDAKYDPKA